MRLRGTIAGTEEHETGGGQSTYAGYFRDLYAKSGAHQFGLTIEDFAAILDEVGDRYLPADASQAEVGELQGSLHLEDLVLARACAGGSELAWERFLNQYRQTLYDAACAMAKEESVARELADGLYADLFGVRQTSGGERISKLSSYTGRGSLEGWLKTVLAQEYVNRYRKARRLVSFEEKSEAGEQFAAKPAESHDVDARLEQAVDQALAEVPPDERLLLVSWYLDCRTLADIARLLQVHESTVSRRIDKITKWLRKRILQGLRDRGLDARAAEEAMEADVRDLFVDVQGRLVQRKGT
jgi:RNA polymerase sigma-70 factor (ECF subfamily)